MSEIRDRRLVFILSLAFIFLLTPSVRAWSLDVVAPEVIGTAVVGRGAQAQDKLDAIRSFYEDRQFKPFWLKRQRNMTDLIGAIEQSWTHGLSPRRYHYDKILELKEQVKQSTDKQAAERLEMLLMGAYLDYVHDMTGMRLDARGLNINPKSFKSPVQARAALDLLSQRGSVGRTLSNLEPKSRTYRILRKELMYQAGLPEAEQDKDKILTLVANLERLRWVYEDRPDKFIVVNIPAARLWAMDKGRVVLDIPVIVGRSKRPTYSFVTEVTGVRINPTWTVPPTVKREDIIPKIRDNPAYLDNKGMELVSGGRTIDPASVDWENLTPAELSGLQMVQMAGAHNPLGRLRILMDNGYDIYIHHTNSEKQFYSEYRAVSSGCIRIQDPDSMLAYIMAEEEKPQGMENWAELFQRRGTRDIQIQKPFPVYLLYYTAWVDENGEVVYGNDIYGMDKKILNKIDAYVVPVHNGV